MRLSGGRSRVVAGGVGLVSLIHHQHIEVTETVAQVGVRQLVYRRRDEWVSLIVGVTCTWLADARAGGDGGGQFTTRGGDERDRQSGMELRDRLDETVYL